ncbi:MAG: ZIP family metal transporter [Weeksellaceae bacterium]
MQSWIYPIISVLLVSLISFLGVLTLAINTRSLKKILLYLVSFSAGALMGDVFIHLLPEVAAETGFSLQTSMIVLLGIVISFVMEKVINWRHCHLPMEKGHVHSFAYMNLFGDAMHNFIDGLIIGASYLVSVPVGIATTLAIIFHEIPQEIGDFGVLIHGGFSRTKALFYNFSTALTAILGTVLALIIGTRVEAMTTYLIPFAAGSFIYIAGSDLIPELHKETGLRKGILQSIAFMLGIGVMYLLISLE